MTPPPAPGAGRRRVTVLGWASIACAVAAIAAQLVPVFAPVDWFVGGTTTYGETRFLEGLGFALRIAWANGTVVWAAIAAVGLVLGAVAIRRARGADVGAVAGASACGAILVQVLITFASLAATFVR